MSRLAYPVIDLFAGPGGLGEGFSSLNFDEKPSFKTLVSIEHDTFAHRTLILRHFFRNFAPNERPIEYYNYLSGTGSFDDFKNIYPMQWTDAINSALSISL
ncbi:MAG: hypothetical protein OXF46_11325, partial [Rhodobacteraceae bacterium]|nr:hypothetical protein [Paracoccaceae bacterium]